MDLVKQGHQQEARAVAELLSGVDDEGWAEREKNMATYAILHALLAIEERLGEIADKVG